MATCKDCLHFVVCDSGRHIGEYIEDEGVYSEGVEKECKGFKNKANFVEVKHGEWKWGHQNGQYGIYCTNCKAIFVDQGNVEEIAYSHDYCPKCGADMRKGGVQNDR